LIAGLTGAKSALAVTRNASAGEKAVIFCDEELKPIGDAFANAALELGLWTKLVILKGGDKIRKDLEPHIREQITLLSPDIYVNLFRNLDEETAYRIKFNKLERQRKGRIIHSPGITLDMITDGAAALTEEEYQNMFTYGEKLKEALKGTKKVHITCPYGSDFTFTTGGKDFVVEKGGNIPCGEVMLMPPIGDSFQGKLVCISGGASVIYRDTPVTITSDDGIAGTIECKNSDITEKIRIELDRDEGARYLGEFAFGINPRARLVDSFLEAEKVIGTIHIAFGGSYKPSKTHIDLLIENPTVTITKSDNENIIVMKDGKIMGL